MILCWRPLLTPRGNGHTYMIVKRKRSQNPSWELAHCSVLRCAVSVPPVICQQPVPDSRSPASGPTPPCVQHLLQQCKVLFIRSEHELIMPGRLPDTGLHFAVLAINIPSSCRHNQRGKQRSKSRRGDEGIRGSPMAKERRDIFSPSPSPLQSDGLSLARAGFLLGMMGLMGFHAGLARTVLHHLLSLFI